MRVGTLTKIIVFLFGYQFIYEIEKKGYYLFKCPKHGYRISYLRGYDERLECNECLKKSKLFYS